MKLQELYGITETIDNEKYIYCYNTARTAFHDAMEVFNSESYKTKKGWRKETEDTKTGDVVFSTPMKDGRYLYGLKAEINAGAPEMMEDIVSTIDTAYLTNDNYEISQRVCWLGSQSDVIYIALKDHFVVRGRDMMTARIWREVPLVENDVEVGTSYVIAGRSVECALKKPDKYKVRANVTYATARFIAKDGDPEKCVMEYLMSGDLKGSIPKMVVDSVMGKYLVRDVSQQRKRAQKITDAKKEADIAAKAKQTTTV